MLKEHGKREKIGNPVSLEQDPATRGPATSTGNSAAPPQQASATAFYGNKPAAAPAPQRATAQKPRYKLVYPTISYPSDSSI